jgi:hypothetical protein
VTEERDNIVEELLQWADDLRGGPHVGPLHMSSQARKNHAATVERAAQTITDLQGENERLRWALTEYGWHTMECEAEADGANCGCGFMHYLLSTRDDKEARMEVNRILRETVDAQREELERDGRVIKEIQRILTNGPAWAREYAYQVLQKALADARYDEALALSTNKHQEGD